MSSSNTNTGIFITDTGIAIPDTVEIRTVRAQDFKNVWGQDLDTSPYTPQGQIIDTETAVIDDKNSQLQYVLNQFDPEKNEGIWQEGIGKIYFITRKPAAPTTVICQVVGIIGTLIPSGSLVQSDTNVLYQTTADFTITSSSPMDLIFTCTQTGPIECAAGTINRIFSQIPGWDTVANTNAGIIGSLEETRIAFERRRYDSVAKNAHGNVDAVRGAIANIVGVLSVKIAENNTGWDSDSPEFISRFGIPWPGIVVHNHSMYISVVGGTDNEIAEAIWERIDGGCGQDGNTTIILHKPTPSGLDMLEEPITFNRPENILGFVQVTIHPHNNVVGDIDTLIQQAVVDAWDGLGSAQRVEIGDTVYGLRFACPVNALDGFDLVSIKVARDVADIFEDSFSTTLNEFAVIAIDRVIVIHQ